MEGTAHANATTTASTTNIDTDNATDTTTVNVDNTNDTNDADTALMIFLVPLMWRLVAVDAGR